LSPITVAFTERFFEFERHYANSFLTPVTLMGDTRYGAPTRHGMPTTNGTTSILNERTGGILALINTNRNVMSSTGVRRSTNLESYGTPIVFDQLVRELGSVFGYIHDSSSSGGKIVRERSPAFAPINNLHDSWHFKKFPAKGWKTMLSDLKNKGFTKTVVETIGFPTIWNHMTYAHYHGFGDPMVTQKIIRNASQHYQDIHTDCRGGKCESNPAYKVEHKIVFPEELAAFTTFLETFSTGGGGGRSQRER